MAYEVNPLELERTKRFMKREDIQAGMNTVLLVHRAVERGVTVRGGQERRADLSFQGRTAWFRSGNSSLNSLLAKRTVNHKAALSRVLRSYGLRAPENQVFKPGEAQRAWAWAEPIAPVVVKPPDGKLGRLVHVDVSDIDEFEQVFTVVADAEGEVLVEQLVPGVDHRMTVVGGTVAGATRRLAAHVIGDGASTVSELVEAKNVQRARRRNSVHRKLQLGQIERAHLSRQGLSPDTVAEANATVWLRGAANVDTGGDAIDATDELRPHEIAYVERAVRELPGLGLCGFDVLLDHETGADPWILEINASPVISPHYFPWQGQPRDVMSRVLEAMFPNLPQEGAAA